MPNSEFTLPKVESQLIVQDTSLLFSSASALRPALPYTLLTKDHNYITAYTLQSATTPADVEIVKYYYRPHVEDIERELSQVISCGSAAAEEWSKGLDARGRERMRVAENWERWEVKYQWWEQHQEPRRATSAAPSLAATSHKEPSKSPARQMPSPVIHAPVPASKYHSAVLAVLSDVGVSQLHPYPFGAQPNEYSSFTLWSGKTSNCASTKLHAATFP